MDTDPRTGSDPGSHTFAPNIVLGLGILGLGLALLLDRLGVLNARDLLEYWPILLVLFGASVVWQAWRGRVDGEVQRPIVSPGLVLLLIIIGVFATRTGFRTTNQATTSTSSSPGVSAVLGEGHQINTSAHFQGADMMAFMGGSTLDLRQSTIPEGQEAVINVVSMMGGLNLYVPRNWVVIVDVVPIMGGVEDRRGGRVPTRRDENRDRDRDRDQAAEPAPAQAETTPPPDPSTSPNAPRLVVRGFIMMSGLDIRY